MGYHKVKVTRTKTETAIIEDVELEGHDNDSVDGALEDLENDERRKEKLLNKADWELEDESLTFEVDEYGDFDDEEDE